MQTEIILIRGLFRGQFHWRDFPEILQASLPARTIRCLDIPGVGELHKQLSPCSIEGMVESLRAQLNTQQPIEIVSISMGGMIAMKWAELYPHEVKSLVCINTSAKGFTPFYQRLRPTNYPKIVRAIFSKSYQRESIIYSFASNREKSEEVIASWVALDQRYPMQSKNFFRQLYAALRFNISKPDCRLYFICSVKDQLVSYRATQALAKAWHVDAIYNQQAGHDISLDDPNWLSEKIASLLGAT